MESTDGIEESVRRTLKVAIRSPLAVLRSVASPFDRVPGALACVVLVLAFILGYPHVDSQARASEPGRASLRALKKALSGEDSTQRRAALLDIGRSAPHLSKEQSRSATLLLRRELDEGTDTESRRLAVRALARLHNPAAWIPIALTALDDREEAIHAAARLEVFSEDVMFSTQS